MQDGEVVARNYSNDPELEQRFRVASKARDREQIRIIGQSLPKLGHLYNHAPAKLVFSRLHPGFVAGSYKFTIIRHPYERAVSAAYFRCWMKGLPPEAFADELNALLADNSAHDDNIYRINGRLVVNDVLRLENFEADMRRVFLRFGFRIPAVFPRAKNDIRRDRRPPRY